jgi:hypothetical protein
MKRKAALPLVFALAGWPAAGSDIVDDVRSAAGAREFRVAGREISGFRQRAGNTPQLLEAESWLARALLEARQ